MKCGRSPCSMDSRSVAVALVLILLSPLAGSIAAPSANSEHTPLDSTGFQLIEEGLTTEIPDSGTNLVGFQPKLVGTHFIRFRS